jgi:hypothetical protein
MCKKWYRVYILVYFVFIVWSVDFWLVLTIHTEFAYYKIFITLGKQYFCVCVLRLILFSLVLSQLALSSKIYIVIARRLKRLKRINFISNVVDRFGII